MIGELLVLRKCYQCSGETLGPVPVVKSDNIHSFIGFFSRASEKPFLIPVLTAVNFISFVLVITRQKEIVESKVRLQIRYQSK